MRLEILRTLSFSLMEPSFRRIWRQIGITESRDIILVHPIRPWVVTGFMFYTAMILFLSVATVEVKRHWISKRLTVMWYPLSDSRHSGIVRWKVLNYIQELHLLVIMLLQERKSWQLWKYRIHVLISVHMPLIMQELKSLPLQIMQHCPKLRTMHLWRRLHWEMLYFRHP